MESFVRVRWQSVPIIEFFQFLPLMACLQPAKGMCWMWTDDICHYYIYYIFIYMHACMPAQLGSGTAVRMHAHRGTHTEHSQRMVLHKSRNNSIPACRNKYIEKKSNDQQWTRNQRLWAKEKDKECMSGYEPIIEDQIYMNVYVQYSCNRIPFAIPDIPFLWLNYDFVILISVRLPGARICVHTGSSDIYNFRKEKYLSLWPMAMLSSQCVATFRRSWNIYISMLACKILKYGKLLLFRPSPHRAQS